MPDPRFEHGAEKPSERQVVRWPGEFERAGYAGARTAMTRPSFTNPFGRGAGRGASGWPAGRVRRLP